MSNKKNQLNISGSNKELSFGTFVSKKHIGISLPKKKKIVRDDTLSTNNLKQAIQVPKQINVFNFGEAPAIIQDQN